MAAADDAKAAAGKAGNFAVETVSQIFHPKHWMRNAGVVGLTLFTGGTLTAMAGGAGFFSAAGSTLTSAAGAAWTAGGQALTAGHAIVTQTPWTQVGNAVSTGLNAGIHAPTL